jgi:16S rRNA processing protein RimM
VKDSPTLVVGYVARAHWTGGELGIRTFDAGSVALDDVERVVLRGRDGVEREFVVTGSRPASKEVLLSLESIDGRAEAEALRGSTVLVYREDLAPPDEGEYFQGDLVGLKAISAEGEPLGKVEEVWNAGPVPTLVIRGEGGELLVPFADEFVPEVDLAAGFIRIRPLQF